MFRKRKLLGVLRKHQDTKQALVVTGFRRVGKTALMRKIYDDLPSPNKLFLDMESPVNQRLFEESNYDTIKVRLEQLGLAFNRKVYLFLDEIQHVKQLPSAVKYLYDHFDIKFYLTGSSSFYLKNLFSESLAGRKFLFELFPLDFEEFLQFKDTPFAPDTMNHDDLTYDRLSGLYEEFLFYGGFPSVVLAQSAETKRLELDDVLGSYFQLDVQSLSTFRDNRRLKDLLFLLSSRIGSKADVTKLADTLGVSRQTVYGYLNFFEQTYLIHLLKPFSSSPDVQIRLNPKIYFLDTGIAHRIAQLSKGQLFENKVFNQLCTRSVYAGTHSAIQGPLSYYQAKTGAEIDFIVNRKTAVEVKLHASSQDVRRLEKIAHTVGIPRSVVVSLQKPRRPDPHIILPYAL